ncbi:MAG: ABC transporter permease subunit [Candidatus Altiarchaeota archaeon]
MKGEYRIAWREFKAMMREKSFVMVLLFEILLVSSSAFLSVGYDVLTSPETSDLLRGARNVIYAGIVTDSKTEVALPLQQSGITYFSYDSLTKAEEDFRGGLLDTVIVGNINLRTDPTVLTVYLPTNTPKVGVIRLTLKRFFLNLEGRLRRVKMMLYTPELKLLSYDEAARGDERNFEVFLLFTIPLLFFMPAIMAGSLVIDSLTEDMESGRILNLLAAPIGDNAIVKGKCLGALYATIPHCIIWLIVLSFTEYKTLNPVGIAVAFTLYATLFTSIGAVMALHFQRNRTAQMAYTLVCVASIALFSPSANASEVLIRLSPAHILTNLALGASIVSVWWQMTGVMMLTALIGLFLMKNAGRVYNSYPG